MNKLYSLILILFISAAAFAAERPRSGRLTISTFDNSDIRVEIDGRRYSSNDNSVRINNINSGYHSVQVFRRQSSGVFGGNREKLVYSSSINVRPEFQTDILIDRSGRAQVREYDLNRNNRNDRRNNKNDDWDRRNDNARWEDYSDWDNKRPDRNDDNWNRNNGSYNNGGNNNGYGRVVSYETFQSMKQSLRRESFENSRVTMAKQMIDRNSFEAAQVREMLQMFSFESNKLELAKYAYRNTVDRNNFYAVYDVFSFSSSRDELSRYINGVR
jgi:hypothetical protein